MLLHVVLLYLLPTTHVAARSSIITITETSYMVDFRANFRLSTSQTSTAQSSTASNDLILEWEKLLPEFTGYLLIQRVINVHTDSRTFYHSTYLRHVEFKQCRGTCDRISLVLVLRDREITWIPIPIGGELWKWWPTLVIYRPVRGCRGLAVYLCI
jgi:hypothetical protein